MKSWSPPQARRAARVLIGVALVGVLAHLLFTVLGLGKPEHGRLFNEWVYDGVLLSAASACLLRAIVIREERGAWLAIAAGSWSWAIGDVYWNFELSRLEEIPYPSIADGFYLAGYVGMYVGLGLLVRSRVSHFEPSLWLDGVIGGLAAAALGAAFVYPALQGGTAGDVATVVVNLAYPLGDLLLIGLVIAGLALTGWRMDRGLLLFAGGLVAIAVADSIYLQREATVGYTEGSWFDSLWLVGGLATAAAAWTPRLSRGPARLEGRRVLALPALFAVAAGLLEIYDQAVGLNPVAEALASATLFAVIVRMVFTFDEHLRLLRVTRREALTDALTGLGNRRRLLQELDHALEASRAGKPHLFAMFDLDGFKAYNDSFGHPAGDVLLARLGENLEAAVQPQGAAYRLGGDEFCVIVPVGARRPNSIVTAASAALSEEGGAFSIGNSRGVVELPSEAADREEALRLADGRLYAQKSRRPRSPERQTRNVLLRILRERAPGFADHLEGVTHLAVALGQTLELGPEDLDTVARAAELHDVGKMAIPDRILTKPGPLDDAEWNVMRGHTVIGERILASAPALAPVAKLVRSSHERWDGDGYPDRLAADQIPLGARIIAICDAFEAMIEDRAWRRPMTPDEALAELRRCAGTQFDPELVLLFAGQVYPHYAPRQTPGKWESARVSGPEALIP